MRGLNRAIAVAGVISLIGLVAGVAPAQGSDESSRRWSGDAAISHLGSRLASVAASSGATERDLRDKFKNDKALHVDANDRLLYIDPPVPRGALAARSSTLDPTFSDANAFLLHSLPGATRVIYLDFNGHMISGTAWNTSTGGDCYAEPFSSDADSTAFTAAELGIVQSVWRRVAADYAAFDVDVTTEDPGVAGLGRDTISDVNYGARALITKSTSNCLNGKTLYQSICPSGCGGIAYVGVYGLTGTTHDYYQPALIFQNGVTDNPKYVAEAASHEVGHNVGLSHDGTSTTGYYQGQGSWAPIMGASYYKPITQWSKGEYSGANNTQDDFTVMVNNGLPLRTDDYGNTPGTATPLGISPAIIDGEIGRATDVDVFSFSAATGPATFSAAPSSVSPNLDIKLTLTDSAGTVVASDDPASGTTSGDVAFGLSATISASLTSGVYTLTVDGVGYGSASSTGYSDYASLGSYRLSGSFSFLNDLAPTARATATPTSGTYPLAVAFDGSTSSDPEAQALTYAWSFGTGTTTSTLSNPSFTYTAAGTFTATLTVKDPIGQTSIATVSITVAAPLRHMDISAFTVTGSKINSRSTATAKVTVRDSLGVAVAGASVVGNWYRGGTLISTKTQTTSSTGIATSSSGAFKVATGTIFKFCVTGIALTNATWNPTIYAPSSATDCMFWTVP